jgi:putative spermidine/putrescine transport system permease protein
VTVRRPSFVAVVTVLTSLFLVVPTIVVLIASLSTGRQIVFPPHGLTFHWYGQIVGDAPTWHALLNSFYVAGISVFISIVAGVPAALALPELRTYRRVLATLALSLGLFSPIIVSAFSFFDIFLKTGLVNHLTVVGLCVGIVTFPFMLWTVTSALEDQDPELPAAAATLGADPVEQFLFVRLPLIAPGIITGAIIVFVLSITDFVVSEVLTNVNDYTLPVFIYSSLRSTVSPSLGAAAALFILVAAGVFLSVLRLGGVERFLLRQGRSS